MNLRKIALPVMAVAALGLVACGESGTTEQITNNYTSGMEIVDLVSSLPKCAADNAGEQYLVKADADVYVCTGKDWKVLGGSGATAADYACETKPLADDRGVAIYCGGDSIGVVLNGAKGDKGDDGERGEQGIQGVAGEKGETGAQGIQGEKGETGAQGIQGEQGVAGADGKDGLNGADGKDGADGKPGEKGETGAAGAAGKDGADGVGCKVIGQTTESVTIQCGDDKFSMNLNGGSAGDIIEDVPEVSLEKLNGVSQKGPYINGASVTLFELDGSKSLMQTGRTFGGEIISDDGRFSVNNVTLNSSYVRLTANGYYRNEVSGENTTSALTLYAYSDLKRRTSVNINLLTHLEYYRVGYLMGNSDGSLTISAAKKMAQKEIFQQFYIENTGFKNSEDMDVFGSSEGDAALLAISVLLQGSRNVTELTSLLSDFGTKISEKGEWDDPVTRAKIADWADSVDLGLKGGLTLPKIESNVSGWGLGTVPAFQKYVRNFWYKEYGLGDCDESNKNVVVRDTNSKSAYYSSKFAYDGSADKKVRFICDEKSKLWRRATDLEKDTFGWGHDFATGDVRNGRVNTNLVYVYEDGNWRHGTKIDSLMFKQKADGGKACTKGSLNDTSAVKVDDLYYVCSVGEQDTAYRWTNTAGDFYNDTYEAREECAKGVEGVYGDGSVLRGRLNNDKVYVCEGGKFRLATENEARAEKACNEFFVGEYAILNGQYSYYKCDGEDWEYTLERLNTGMFTDERDGREYKYVGIKSQMWMAENLNYRYTQKTSTLDSSSFCYEDDPANCDKYGRLYTWSAVMDSVAVFSSEGIGCGYGVNGCKSGVRGICPQGWHVPSVEEWDTLLSVAGQNTTYGAYIYAGKKLRSSDEWYDDGLGIRYTYTVKGTDDYGFSALPGGTGGYGVYDGIRKNGDYWSSSNDSSYVNGEMAFSRGFSWQSSDAYKHTYSKGHTLSVRCLKDSF